MRLGNNEKIVIAIIRQYPKINKKQLDVLFHATTKKKGRIDMIIHSLKIKGVILNANNYSVDLEAIEEIILPEIDIGKKTVQDIKHLDTIKIGHLGKSLLYTIGRTEKSSLQFLSVFFQKPSKNIYAILQRLEEREMVFSFNSRIRRTNSVGRRYHPKYYTLTEQGKLWLSINDNWIQNKERIDELLKKPEDKIEEYDLRL